MPPVDYYSPRRPVQYVPLAPQNERAGSSSTTKTYTASRQQSVVEVARQHGVTTSALIAANPGLGSRPFLAAGDTINVPQATEPRADAAENGRSAWRQVPREQEAPVPPMDLETATDILDRDFGTFDTAKNGGEGDGKVSKGDLEAAAKNNDGTFTPEQQATAQFLLDSKATRSFLDVGASKNDVDGVISERDVMLAKASIDNGTYVGRLIDTASGKGGADHHVSSRDVDAALADPGVPETVKDAIRLAQAGDVGVLADLTLADAEAAGKLYNSDSFQNLSADEQALIGKAFCGAGGAAAFSKNLDVLLESPEFQSLSLEERTAVLSQINNYPDAQVVENLDKLIDQGWFQSMSLEDKQRTLKVIAEATTYSNGDRTILDNTLTKILEDGYAMRWEAQEPGVGAYYESSSNTVAMNLTDVAADNEPIEGDAELFQAIGGLAHEINHGANEGVAYGAAGSLYESLEYEYTAYYTDFEAANGQPMTREEAVDQWRYLLEPQGKVDEEGIYDELSVPALADPAESAEIFGQISRLTGVPVDASNYTIVMGDPSLWDPPYGGSGPDIAVPTAALPTGDTTNG